MNQQSKAITPSRLIKLLSLKYHQASTESIVINWLKLAEALSCALNLVNIIVWEQSEESLWKIEAQMEEIWILLSNNENGEEHIIRDTFYLLTKARNISGSG